MAVADALVDTHARQALFYLCRGGTASLMHPPLVYHRRDARTDLQPTTDA
jgi:hypothetical protein